MLFRRPFLDGIRDGAVTVAFRRWRRPSVREGGTLLTSVGQLAIGSVRRVEADRISPADAKRAGYASLDALLAELGRRPEGDVYRIELGPLGPDPRIALGESPATDRAEIDALVERLERLDRAAGGPWTRATLELVDSRPGVRAGDLSALAGQEKERFKLNVRKLKNLGLTESLETGYRLSPRGRALLGILGRS